MTTTVKVMARAWGAVVAITRPGAEAEKAELGPHEDRVFDIAEGETVTFEVTHGAEPEPEAMTAQDEGFVDPATGTDPSKVPGRAENDALLGKTAGAEKVDTDGKVGSSRPRTERPVG